MVVSHGTDVVAGQGTRMQSSHDRIVDGIASTFISLGSETLRGQTVDCRLVTQASILFFFVFISWE